MSESAPTIPYKVPRLLWENFESILLAQSRRYIGELARYLNVPERELQKRVLPSSDTLLIQMVDSSAESLQCRAYIQHHTITTFCRKPTAYPSEFCEFHKYQRMNVIPNTHPTIVEKVADQPDREPVWIQGNTLVNAHGEMVGKINKNTQTVKWFTIEE